MSAASPSRSSAAQSAAVSRTARAAGRGAFRLDAFAGECLVLVGPFGGRQDRRCCAALYGNYLRRRQARSKCADGDASVDRLLVGAEPSHRSSTCVAARWAYVSQFLRAIPRVGCASMWWPSRCCRIGWDEDRGAANVRSLLLDGMLGIAPHGCGRLAARHLLGRRAAARQSWRARFDRRISGHAARRTDGSALDAENRRPRRRAHPPAAKAMPVLPSWACSTTTDMARRGGDPRP